MVAGAVSETQRDAITAGLSSRSALVSVSSSSTARAGSVAHTGQPDKAERLFREATKISTISETYYNYAMFLQSQGRSEEARQWAQKILDKRLTMPSYLRRRERPWFRKAYALLARLRVQRT